MGNVNVHALGGVDLSIEKGDFVSIMGASGSGKSTLMNIMGCLDRPTEGAYTIDGLDTQKAGYADFADIRNQKIGFVFQNFNLLPRTSALENVELPLIYNRRKKIENPLERAETALRNIGLGDRIHHLPSELSGGQQQRVAIARALVNEPVFLLADEPTGNLDSATTSEIMQLFVRLNREGITIVMVTHEPDVAAFSKRQITMKDGFIIEDVAVCAGKAL